MDERGLAIGLTVTSLSLAASGAALLVLRRAVLAGALLVLTAVLVLAGVVLAHTDAHGPAALAYAAAGMVAAPLALTAYPRLRRQHPVDVAALIAIAGLGLAACVWRRHPDVLGSLTIATSMVVIAHTWWRIETGTGDERRALVWMAVSLATTGLVIGMLSFVADSATTPPLLALLAVVGPALYVGVALPEIVDVRGLVVRAVVLGVALVTYLALFVGAASLLETVTGDVPALGTLGAIGALAALTFHPLQVMLRGVVDELLFGRRPDPLDAANRVAGQVGDDPVLALRAIREALVLPYASLRSGGAELAVSGEAVTHTRTYVLEGAGAELVVGLRPGDLTLPKDDDHVLRLVAPLLAQALRARALATDLQASRGATIAALEEERRRLRRDLHDGLGPRLSGIAFTSDAARNLLRTDPEAADALLRQLRADTATAIEDIRRLVYAMRPPALDELGLVPALRQQSAGLRNRHGLPLRVAVQVPEELPPLSAAVEVATYRIVLEALTNEARHADSTTASVCLRVVSGELVVEVSDHGGSPPLQTHEWRAGVGLTSMRERATELGGSLTAGPTADCSMVRVVLPLPE